MICSFRGFAIFKSLRNPEKEWTTPFDDATHSEKQHCLSTRSVHVFSKTLLQTFLFNIRLRAQVFYEQIVNEVQPS